MKPLVAFSSVVCLLLSGRIVLADAEGVTADVGGVHLQASAVSDHIFRLSLNRDGEAAKLNSIYLDPSRPAEIGGEVRTNGTLREIHTSAGTLKIDTATGRYQLLDSAGNALIPETPAVPTQRGEDQVAVRLGWPADRPFAVYASGNPNDKLIQPDVEAHVNNGVAVQPFFWSSHGVAVFVVGTDPDAPAACDGKVVDHAVTLTTPGRAADVYLMIAPRLDDATHNLLALTGRPPVPPLWSFGYLQSRWGWEDAAYIDNVIREFDTRRIPVDAFIFDYEWYTQRPDFDLRAEGAANFPDFGINPKLFPSKATPFEALDRAGLRMVGIRKPRLGDAETLTMARAKGWDARRRNGDALMDQRAIDFSNTDLHTWYVEHTLPLLKAGVDGWWNDEGEFTYSTYTYWNRTQRDALDKIDARQRLWTINRAFAPGLARFGAAAWTGDIPTDWKSLRKAPADLLNWSMAGMPYGSTDIGGFFGTPSPELLTRWMQAGTFFPNMRAHSLIDARPHFPWLYGTEAEASMRHAIELRYRLVPYLYSLAHACEDRGALLMRPLVSEFPDEPALAELTDQWMVGPGLMAAPVLVEGGKRDVILPAGTWYDFATGTRFDGGQTLHVTCTLDQVPAYVRAGTILPLAAVATRTADLVKQPLEVRIYPGANASFTLVEDDGATNSYRRGDVRKTTFTWDEAARTLRWQREGTFNGPAFASMRVRVVGVDAWESSLVPLSDAGEIATSH